MAKSGWLVIDGNNFAYRSYFSMGAFGAKDASGMIHGFLRDLVTLINGFRTTKVAFCWDHGFNERYKINKTYKSKRNQETDHAKLKQRADIKEQITLLKRDVLPRLGFRNMFFDRGLEADDMVCIVTKILEEMKQPSVIVSSDQDYYQLLSDLVVCFDPVKNKIMNAESFRKEFGIQVEQWPLMKALAGCSSDSIRGVEGVGPVSALLYLQKKLGENTKAMAKINAASDVILENLKLIKLPLRDPREIPKFVKDDHSLKAWEEVCTEYKMDSLVRLYPFAVKKAT